VVSNSDSELRDGQYGDARNLSARFGLHQRFSTNRYPFHRWVFDQFAFPADARVLELGCGFGALWSTNRDRIQPDWNVTLSDFSFGMLCDARQNLKSVGHFNFLQIDAGAIPYRDRTVDAVIANQMLYHVRDLGQALHAIRRVLKTGARLYATTVGASHMRRLKEIAQRFVAMPPMDMAERFGLESGLTALRQLFMDVRREVVYGELRVTEGDPVVDYICSLTTPAPPPGAVAAMRRHIEDEIRARGAIEIGTESGILIATV
jgi:ubiquinone/menaquinone biosynthesis C-methylase UbiE